MCSNLLLLLLFCVINYSGTPSVGNNLIPVTGKKGGNVTLTCASEDREITRIVLIRQSKNILFCEKQECESENDRLCKEESCDVIIKDLIYSDAGKYILRVYYSNNDQTEEYHHHLHFHEEISVKKGEHLKLDVLLSNAYKVQRNSRSGWTELWTRGHGVSSDRLTVSDQTLIIHEFTDTDTETYRVLDSNNEAWITVTVTESVLDSKGNLNDTDKDKTDDTEHRNHWILLVGLTVVLVLVQMVLVVLVVLAAAGIHRLRQRLLEG